MQAHFNRLHQNLAKRKRRRQQLVVPFKHVASKLGHALGMLAVIFKKINEEIRVPEYSAQSQFSRRRRIYSSACSFAQISRPDPRRASSGSFSTALGRFAEYSSAYQSSR